MNEEALENYKNLKIPVHYLVKTAHDTYTEIAEQYQADGTCHICTKPQEKEVEQQKEVQQQIEMQQTKEAQQPIEVQEISGWINAKKTPYGRYLQTGVRAALAGNTAKNTVTQNTQKRQKQADGYWSLARKNSCIRHYMSGQN